MDRFYRRRQHEVVEIGDQLRIVGRHLKVPALRELGDRLHYYCRSTQGVAKGTAPLVAELRGVRPAFEHAIRTVRLASKREALRLFLSLLGPLTDAAVTRYTAMAHLKLKLEEVVELTRATTERGMVTRNLFEPQKAILQPLLEAFYAAEALDEEAAYELAKLFRSTAVAICRSMPNDVIANEHIDELELALDEFETAVTLEALL